MPDELTLEDSNPLARISKELGQKAGETAVLYGQLSELLGGLARQASQTQSQFLHARQASLQQIEELLKEQVNAGGKLLTSLGVLPLPNLAQLVQAASATVSALASRPAVLFDRAQLDEFALGSMAKCFGSEFEVFEGRRIPRIPNGDFLLLSRVISINGRRLDFKTGATIRSEYDVPADAWYYQDNSYPAMPYGFLMEIALQPCGFLSAFLGTSLLFPQQDFYFRNLDGEATLLSEPDLRGKTVTTLAKMRSSLAGGGTIIQKFEYELTCEGRIFFKGEAVFGYFTPEAMANQTGLDGGQSRAPRGISEQNTPAMNLVDLAAPSAFGRFTTAPQGRPHQRLASNRLRFIQRLKLARHNQQHQNGYIYASKDINRADWYFDRHFYQDPVMPGSLGIEAVLQSMQAYALEYGLADRFISPRFSLLAGSRMNWKYRGQIIPRHKTMQLEVDIHQIDETAGNTVVVGDASVWAEDMRIYEITGAAITICEA
jgi:3-hydroxymyristoyl/3-hydroxydecanoyl-(acyl carrier protein) dehydratase